MKTKKLVQGVPFLSTPSDTLADAKAYDKWDKQNKDRVQKMPELSTNTKHNRLGFKPDLIIYDDCIKE